MRTISKVNSNVKHADKALYETIFELSPGPILLSDTNGFILDVNPAYLSVTQYSRQELVGKHVSILAGSGRSAEKIQEDLENLLAGHILNHTVTGRRKDGSVTHLTLNEKCIQLPNGQTVIISIAKDISKEFSSEQALILSNRRLELLNNVGFIATQNRNPKQLSKHLVFELRKYFNVDAFILDGFCTESFVAIGLGRYDTIDNRFSEMPIITGEHDWYKSELGKRIINGKKVVTILRSKEQLANVTKTDRPSASLIYMPLISEKRVVGVLSIQSYKLNAYNEYDSALLSDVAYYIAPAVESMLLNTALVKSNEKIKQSEERLRNMFRNNYANMLVYNPYDNFKIVDVNNAAVEFYGYEKEKFNLLHLNDIVVGLKTTDPQNYEKDHRAIYTHFLSKHILANGEVRDVEVFLSPVTIGEKLNIFAIIHDITKRVTAQNEVKQQFNQLTSIYNLTQAINRSLSLDEIFELAIDTITTSIGLSRSSILLFNDAGEMEFKAWRNLSDAYRKATSGHSPWKLNQRNTKSIICKNVFKDPTLKEYTHIFQAENITALAFIPLIYRDKVKGKFMLYSSLKKDFSEEEIRIAENIGHHIINAIFREKDRLALKNSEELFRAVTEQSGEGMAIVGLDGQIRLMNPVLLSLSGYDQEEMADIKCCTLFKERTVQTICKNTHLGKTVHLETVMLTKDCNIVDVDLTIFPIKIAKEKLLLYIIRDIRKKIEAKKQKEKYETQMQRAQKLESLEILAGGLAHDFNNMLTGVMGYAGLAGMEVDTNSSLNKYLKNIEDISTKAANLCHQLLAYSGRSKFIIKLISINTVVTDLHSVFIKSISSHISIRTHLAKNIPLIEVDITQINQLVMNIITNSIDAIGENEGTIDITTGADHFSSSVLKNSYLNENLKSGDYVYIEIKDSGHGMDEDTLKRIFDPFFSTRFTGRGLGLSAVLGIVRSHKGAVFVNSTPEEGATFKVLFPKSNKALREINTPKPVKNNSKITGKILVVDDEQHIRDLTKRTLQRAGYTVLTASDGNKALEICTQNGKDIALVILDMTMPIISGEETYKLLREQNANLPILLSSGYTESEMNEKFINQKLSGFLQKPYKTTELVDKVNSICKKEA